MQDYRPEDGQYVTGPDSIHRAYPMHMSARDLARFALLYPNNGSRAGRQIVPAEWARESTRSDSAAEVGWGYAYLWWTAGANGLLPERSFFAWGAGGQFAFVVPAYDLVVVSRVDRDLHLAEPRSRHGASLVRLVLQAAPRGR